jgi:two-component system sensor kinase FixL
VDRPDIGLTTIAATGEAIGAHPVELCAADTDWDADERRFRLAFDLHQDAIVVLDANGRYLLANQAACDLLGYPLAQLLTMRVLDTPTFQPLTTADQVEKYLTTGRKSGRFHYRRPSGEKCVTEYVATKIGSDEHLCVLRDATAPEAATLVLQHLPTLGDCKLLEGEALEIAVRERRRIGQDLHDNTAQELTGLGLMIGALTDSLARLELPEAQLAGKIQSGIRGVIAEVQAICRGLIPVEIDAVGLTIALHHLSEHVKESTGLDCVLRCHDSSTVDDDVTANELYRIAQEAVHNAVNHAGARHVQIFLGVVRDLIILNICDDGVGIQLPPAGTPGMGLRIMRYRANRIGAQFRVECARGGGSLVSCILVRNNSV